MQSQAGLIARLERATKPDRRLDAEIVAAVLGPPGCVLDPVEGLDGWDIQYAPDADGEAAIWREAADIPGVTTFLDAVCEVVGEARPVEAAALMARALRQLPPMPADATAADLAGRAARAIMAELIRLMATSADGEIVRAA